MKNLNINVENEGLPNIMNYIQNLKNIIESKDNTIQNLQKNHKSLQDKFLKICSDRRIKEQYDLLSETKDMKDKKIERESTMNINKSNNNLINNNNNKSNNGKQKIYKLKI